MSRLLFLAFFSAGNRTKEALLLFGKFMAFYRAIFQDLLGFSGCQFHKTLIRPGAKAFPFFNIFGLLTAFDLLPFLTVTFGFLDRAIFLS